MPKRVDTSRLVPLIAQAFREHQEKDEGLIVGPAKLADRLVKAVQKWLEHHEGEYREEHCDTEALAIRDLRLNLIEEG